jgi:tRNA (cmo5U34)-methyltransferase
MENTVIFEGQRAARYDQTIPIWIPHYVVLSNQLPALLRAYHAPEEDVDILVAGCGTGMEIHALLQTSAGWKFTGIDPSPEMIAQAQQKLSTHQQARYSLVEGTVDSLPPTPAFDAATSILVMHFLPDDGAKLRFLQSIATRLRPGSPFVLVDMFREPESFERYLQMLEMHLVQRGEDREWIRDGLAHIRNDIQTVSEKRVKALLQEAGFTNILRFSQHLIYGGWVAEKVT